MSDYGTFEDRRVKHLELIQAVVSRLGTDSFLIKGWTVTIAGAFLGFAISGKEWGLALTAALPTILFWGLDTYFLRAERMFRALYDAVRTGDHAVEPFFMSATRDPFAKSVENARLRDVGLSLTLGLFYGTLILSSLVVAAILRY